MGEDDRREHAAMKDTAGWPEHDDGHFLAEREERAGLVRKFLEEMDAAGNPGVDRALGSTVREITGQEPDHYWEAEVRSPDAPDERGRAVRIYTDGRHGWTDAITYADRPRAPEDEISPNELSAALDALRKEHNISSGDDSGR